MTADAPSAPAAPMLDHDIEAGAGAGAPGSLLVLHGFGEDKGALRDLGRALCAPSAVVVRPSLRGHGASVSPSWGYSAWELAADVLRLDHVLPATLDVLGYSFGADVALATAVALGPRRVSSLVLLDQSFERRPARHADGPWAEASRLKWHSDHTHLLDAVDAVGIPTLVVYAEHGTVVPPEERARLGRRPARHRRVVSVPGSHRALRDEPAAVVGRCRDFWNRLPISSGVDVVDAATEVSR